MLFALPNLVSKTTSECTPWTFQSPIPDEVKGKAGKKLRDKWINSPETLHQCYSGFEGVSSTQRISEGKGTEEGNPPFKLHAFIADIDCPITDDELATGLQRVGIQPAYFERTLSGNARLIWPLESPVTFPNRKFAIEFLELAMVRMKVDTIAPALDRPAWLEPNRYYTNSCDFYVLYENARVSAGLTSGWMLEVAEKHHWKKQKNAVAIPLPIVFEAISKKYPAHGWEGDFVEEAQGPTFWLEGSTSPKSAIIKPTGFFTFSSTATRSFYSWADLLGAEFVKTYETELLGKAVTDLYHDGKNYYRKDGYGDWKPYTKEDVIAHLTVTRGLNPRMDGDRPSEVSRAMEYLRDWQAVTGAAPFVFQPTGVIAKNGFKFLNTHTRKPLTPALDGRPENFPFIYKYFQGLFDPHEQLDYFFSWLSRFYSGAYTQNLESGQNIFFLGVPGIGKTLLSQGILPILMGGGADAEDYLLGKTQFNSDLFEVGFWSVDDNSATVDAATHRKFTAMSKKMAANTTFSYHAKFRVPCSVDWLGRVFVTANNDEESARIVPDLSLSNVDKLMLLRAAAVAPVEFPSRKEMQRILREELPFFARFLLEYEIPAHCQSSSRFGVKSYHEKSLMVTAEQSSRSAVFAEIIEDWKETWFSEHLSEHFWEGTSFQFLKALNKDELGAAAGIRSLSAEQVSRGLATLRAKGFPFEIIPGDRGSRTWRIHRKELPQAVALPIAKGNS